ncbi:universal stress protein [Roseinatronobacter alkalisoli]|uniref:Universal stress protein n=1 Tax=Roseinatronobacter alkalisoli TaxID=3028235 RepID=A0ABT5T7A0_9RHOB|nr:universal stress protein [Roseinatronobacter sp. HJB301]MDD7971003.1 universal stress protein [Roseinatronobacter sp. HJB301]
MFQKILVPFDGSSNAEAALKKAVELADLTGGEVLILTVYRHHSMLEASFSMVRPSDPGNMDDIMRTHAREVADHGKKVAQDLGAGKVRAFVKAGQPARTIVAWAAEKDVDLIVLSSRGMGSIEGYLLGSVSHKVTALAKCPVMVF